MVLDEVRISFVDALEWERADELADLLYRVLYHEFGVNREGPWRESEPGSVTAVAMGRDGELLGAARLLPEAQEGVRQVRQVAVDPDVRTAGVGRALMSAMEWRAQSEGAREITLHARDTAIAFYTRLGYREVSDTFVSALTGIPHRTMAKSLP